jgi:hypothetical protein
MKKTKFAIFTVLILALLVGTGLVAAAYGKSIGCHVKVTQSVQPTVELGFYSDSQCLTPVDFVEFDNIPQGTTLVKTAFYCKNIGSANATFTGTSTLPAATGVMMLRLGGLAQKTLNVGDSTPVTATITILPDAVLGDVSFSISIGQI